MEDEKMDESEKVTPEEGNSINDLRRYFEDAARPMQPGELIEFWKSLSEDEKNEFRKADLGK